MKFLLMSAGPKGGFKRHSGKEIDVKGQKRTKGSPFNQVYS